MPAPDWQRVFGDLNRSKGYSALSLANGRVTGQDVLQDGVILMSPTFHAEYAGNTPDSWVILFAERGGPVKVLVRGETLRNPPFLDDFAAALQTILGAPDWVVTALRTGQTHETDWGVSGTRKVPLKNCYSAQAANYTLDASGDFAVAKDRYRFRVGWKSVRNPTALTSLCDYIVRLGVETNVVAQDGKHVGQRVVRYSVSVSDVQALAGVLRGEERRRTEAAQREERAIRNSSSKPSF
jgi:hypothetical protein